MITVYTGIIDAKGVYAFQPFTLQRFNILLTKAKEAGLPQVAVFKLSMEEEEIQITIWMIKQKKYLAAGYYLSLLIKVRGIKE